MNEKLIAIARECGGIRSGSFEPVKRWTFTEDGLAAFVARVAPETQSPPEGGEGLANQKAAPKGCPCKHSDCATQREALQRIADMDPKGLRADDLGRAARMAREALAAAQVLSEPADLKQVLDALRVGRVACEWANKQEEAAMFGGAMEAARRLAPGVSLPRQEVSGQNHQGVDASGFGEGVGRG